MLYHLSEINHNNEVFHPRVPYSIMDNEEYEGQKTKRICFSTTLSGAFRAIQFRPNESMELYVHIPYNDNVKYYCPTESQVYDCKFTNEVWVRRKTKMKCIGEIRAYYKNSDFRHWRPKVRVKWLEKY
jgi:coproporphyrinogen III oxidase-like Fe-S oxidoreductase